MERNMKEELNKNYQIIEDFVRSFLKNERLTAEARLPTYHVTNGHDGLKEVDKVCREIVENNFSKKPDILRIMSHNNEEGEWLKELIIDYTILRIYHYVTAWNALQHGGR